MPLSEWTVQDYSAFKSGITSVDALVHYFVKRVSGETMVAARLTPGTDKIYATAVVKDTDPGTDYSDYKTEYIDTEKSTPVVNSIDAEIKLNDAVAAVSQGGKTYEDTLTLEISPVELTLAVDLGKPATNGYVTNDGPGDIIVAYSEDGIEYGSPVTMKNYETISWDSDVFKDGVNSIRLIHSGTDSTYRIFAV